MSEELERLPLYAHCFGVSFKTMLKLQNYYVWIDKNSPVCYFDSKRNIQICSWYPDENEIKVGCFDGGGISTAGISVQNINT
jgi:hypothetical protein